jgi:signal transduction histidine kinase
MKVKTARQRIAMFSAVWTGALLVVYSAFTWFFVRVRTLEETDRAIEGIARSIASDLATEGIFHELMLEEGSKGLPAVLEFRLEDYFAFVTDSSGRVIARSSNLEGRKAPEFFRTRHAPQLPFFWRVDWKRGTDGRYVTWPFRALGRDFSVVVVRPMESFDKAMLNLGVQLAIVLLVLLAAAGALARSVAHQAMEPVERIGATVEGIGAADLGKRVNSRGMDQEFARLSDAINALLERLEATFRSRERFLQFAAHELKTPVSVLLAESQGALQPGASDEQRRESLTAIEWTTRGLARQVDDLFFLARADAGQWPLQCEEFDLAEVVAGTVRALRPVAERRQIVLRLHGGGEIPFWGDAQLLARAAKNLIENAVHFAPEGSTVDVEAAIASGEAVMTVRDQGPGIPPAERERVFEPFYRRALPTPDLPEGAGLGLPIVRWVAGVHGGSVEIDDNSPRGLAVTLRLPVAPSRVLATG